MATLLAGVTFRKIGKLHYYPVGEDFSLEVGSLVVAETERGHEYGEVKILREVEGEPEDMEKANSLVRLASEEDSSTQAQRKQEAEEGRIYCQQYADSLYLPMKVVDS